MAPSVCAFGNISTTTTTMPNITDATLLLEGLLQMNSTLSPILDLLPTTTETNPAEFINTSLASATTVIATTTPTIPELLLQNALSLVSASDSLRRLSPHHNPNHTKAEFSPVTLSPEWSRMSRLLLLSALSILGSVGNIFMISSVVIEDYLKRPGKYHLRSTYWLGFGITKTALKGIFCPPYLH